MGHHLPRKDNKMSIDYAEKRNFIRMETSSKIDFRKTGSNKSYQGQCINLSATGVLFSGDLNVSPGTELDISILPDLTIVPPLQATIEVVRTQLNINGTYNIAAAIKELHQL
jgi:hypothetical protein